jgi:Methyltransferase domain
MTFTTNEPTFLFDTLPLHWQMTRWEKYGFTSILQAAKPKVGIEIGTYQGGSLQVIANHADKIYSIDLDATLKDRLGGQLPNVEFLTGDSRQILPALLNRIMQRGEELGFVLIDGDHSIEGVRCDINNVLRYTPLRPVFIVLHDSFNPDCRKGILTADWSMCDHVHYVEVDFVPGVYHFEAFDTAAPRSMFGGLAVAVMRPERRVGPLAIHQCQKGLFEAVFISSRHAPPKRSSLLIRALRKAKRVAVNIKF